MRVIAKFFSFVFHPLILMTYLLVLLLVVNPYVFGVNNIRAQTLLILLTFISTFLLPLISISMMKGLGMIASFKMEDPTDRIGPFIVTGIFYMWMYINFKNNAQIPPILTSLLLGATIGLFMAFFINIFVKISIHTVGMGGMVAAVALLMKAFDFETFSIHLSPLGNIEMSLNALLMITVLLAGIVGTSRLILQAHRPPEVYMGYAVGILSQMIAYNITF